MAEGRKEMTIHTLLSGLLLLLLSGTGGALELTNMTPLLGGLYAMYSAETSGSRKCLGGWRSAADVPFDLVVCGTRWPSLREKFAVPFVSVNDPAVVRLSDGSWIMYTTRLEAQHHTWPAMVEQNYIGVAWSRYGRRWTDRGPLVRKFNGLDTCGAWSPSALVVGQEIWLYWHGNSPCQTAYRQRFSVNDGVTPLAPPEYLSVPRWLSNIDVAQRPDGRFLVVADFPDLLHIYVLESLDGITWEPHPEVPDGLLIQSASPNFIFTPHIEMIRNDGWDLLFTYGDYLHPGNLSLHRWTFAE
jgi:hypothetical protein